MTAITEYKGQHYDLIKSHIDSAFLDMQLHRSHALRRAPRRSAAWISEADPRHIERINSANKTAWSAQNKIDRLLAKLQDIGAFAEPLLKAKLLERFNVNVDVKNTFLRLYIPKESNWWVIQIAPGYTARTVSLLDAALHNFAYDETFEKDSAFIEKTDAARELFDISPIDKIISVSQFQALCRELDIGAQYKAHLEDYLLNKEPVAQAWLKLHVQRSQQAALKAAAHIALAKKDIGRQAHLLIHDLLEGRPHLKLGEQAMTVCELGMMDLNLTGILIIRPDPDQKQHAQTMIAYVPHDPEHPLKEYASTIEFMNELSRQLRDNQTAQSSGFTYRQFFSQFVDHEQRGHFFAGLEQRLTVVKWYPKDRGDPRPSWRKTPVDKPQLQFSAPPITEPLWTYLYQQQLNKILNDARVIAVSTADADSRARWAWWENFKKIASDIFNVALLVLTPFVPLLGEAMLAYTVYQIVNEAVEGVWDLIEGHYVELGEHVMGVTIDVLQLAAFAGGVTIGNAFKLKLSSLVEGMKPVRSNDGKMRLWHPDLRPYEQPEPALPQTSKPDALGLHHHSGKTLLPIEGKCYEVQLDPKGKTHRVVHPTRAQAYRPEARHNGQGAWVLEGETPQDWEGTRLMQRLGHFAEGYSHAELEKLRSISGTPDNSLRRLHVDNAAPPPLLADTLARFRTWDRVRDMSHRVRTGQPLPADSFWFETIAPGLPGWPANKGLRVYENADLSGGFRQYGHPDATAENTLHISLADMMSGQLPERLTAFLGEPDMAALLGRPYPRDRQVQALRDTLARVVETRTPEIFEYEYRLQDRSDDPQVRLLQSEFPQLPSSVARPLLEQATDGERRIMAEQHRIPLRVKNMVRESAFETRATRAAEGLHEPALLKTDTERLILNTLKIHTDTFEDLRIDVRDGTPDGPLRTSAGPESAGTLRTLIRDERGRYEVFDDAHRKRHEAHDFYRATLLALPEDKRAALGYRTDQGEMFRQWIVAKTAPPSERRTLLARPPLRAVAPRQTELLVRGPGLSKVLWPFAEKTVETKVKEMFAHFDESEVAAFTRSLHAKGDPHQQIERLKQERQGLKQKLEDWRQRYLQDYDPDDGGRLPDAYWDYERKGGRFIAERLMACFERKSEAFGERSSSLEGGYTLDLSTEVLPRDLERWWKQMPDLKPWLEQITTVNLDGQQFSPGPRGLLKDLPNLQQISARHCGLKTLPDSIGQQPRLKTLRLSDNMIELTPRAIEQLQNLKHLEVLRLDNNPLGDPPLIHRMPKLKVLNLANTDVNDWPLGLFSLARPKGFFLDLRRNWIRSMPDVAPGSDKAFLIARTRIDVEKLSPALRQSYELYRESVGISPTVAYQPPAEDLMKRWSPADDASLYSESPGTGVHRPEAWHDLVNEPQSDGFFRVLERLTQSADYRQGGRAKAQLTDRVWRMVNAIDIDTALREELFLMSTDPEGCADAGAQLFNNMGVKVLASEARHFSISAGEVEGKLVTLAKGSARLEQVAGIARADIRKRAGDPDQVEVHLAYETGLAKRLELPWQSEAMRFRPTAGVTDSTINRAYTTIIEAEAGDGLVNQMIEQPFWEQYLRKQYPSDFARNTDHYQDRLELLSLTKEWQEAQSQGQESAELLKRLVKLAEKLSIPLDEVLAGEEMSQAVFESRQRDIGYQERELSRRLTREAMARAGI
ncbi:NEL-type E3 ubiquitin ligase domain-containing protein [Pseudomonas sputi]|uniref:NEL-type E3 ubiquitin ligase domain-containing protein n=1 Tax=Pseudomonas sputi TaxID=2892325 RepID=UPI001F19BAC9|nr:NEL-type E3 ubiquitin ligase domain-containing protein [Pseudomonas sputi]